MLLTLLGWFVRTFAFLTVGTTEEIKRVTNFAKRWEFIDRNLFQQSSTVAELGLCLKGKSYSSYEEKLLTRIFFM